ncbi:MAG: hypothetical protein HKN33_12265 [Pyrinomonadaceae bacterium]|nr:hypothetical protein [Pyrinomonadaceae bacterium]
MKTSEKEIAFLRGLTVEPDWTQNFTDLFDEKFKIGKPRTITYINAGAGNHAIEIFEKLGVKTELFPVCETPELQEHAQLKANNEKIDIDFSTKMPMGKSDCVICDASLAKPNEISDLAKRAAGASNERVALLLPTKGSFGEVFSFLWEVLLELGIESSGVEELITGQTTIDDVEETFRDLALRDIKTHQKTINFDFEDGKEFAASLLMKGIFFPNWLEFVEAKDHERVIENLAKKIDDESEGLSFRFSVKAAVVEGRH